MKKKPVLAVLFLVGCIVIVGIVVFGRLYVSNNSTKSKCISDGVKIEDVDVSGMTVNEARTAVNNYINDIISKNVNISINDYTITATYGALGFTYKDSDYEEKALKIGKSGNIFNRLSQTNKASEGKIVYSLGMKIDKTVLYQYVQNNCSIYDVKAKDSKLKIVNGKLKATKDRTGIAVNVDDTVNQLYIGLMKNMKAKEVSLKAVVQVTEPEYTQEEAKKCTDLMGSYATSYATSTAARATNVQNAAHYIDGTVLYPGETFSTIATIKDRTVENGYKVAPEYSSGKVVDGVGGGVCQVATTLYNAVINAELKIVQRSPHSMVVAYVPVSRDAAISGDYKDLKFKNNTKYPVYIMASASGGVLSFKIYGNDTRPAGRTIEFQSEIVETIQPGDPVETVDSSLPESYRTVTQPAHVGYKAKLWKIVYMDGVQTDKVLLNASSYSAEPEYVTVGKLSATATPSPTDKNKSSDSKSTSTPKSTESSKSKSTATPKATATPKTTKKPSKN